MGAFDRMIRSLLKPRATKPTNEPDERIARSPVPLPPSVRTARAYEEAVLDRLNRYGWLTLRQLADSAGIFLSESEASRRQMAWRTCQRLIKKGLVLTRPLPGIQTHAYVLSARGARQIAGRAGKDRLRHRRGVQTDVSSWQHRWISNSFLLIQEGQSHTVWTEYEIAAGLGPFPPIGGKRATSWLGKRPDGAYLLRGSNRLRWVEVERSRRKPSDAAAIGQFALHAIINDPTVHGTTNVIDGIDLVIAQPDMYRSAARAILTAFESWAATRSPTAVEYAEHRLLTRVRITQLELGPGPHVISVPLYLEPLVSVLR